MTVIPPTMDVSWRDDQQAADDALAILHLSVGGIEAATMLELAGTAGDRICLRLDRTTPIEGADLVTPPILRSSHAIQTAYEYRQKDVGLGTTTAWSPDQVPLSTSNSDFAPGVLESITPYREQWGMA